MTKYQKAEDGAIIPVFDQQEAAIEYIDTVSSKSLSPKVRPTGVTIISASTIAGSIIYSMQLFQIKIFGKNISGFIRVLTRYNLITSALGTFPVQILIIVEVLYAIAVAIGLLYGRNDARILIIAMSVAWLLSVTVGSVYGMIVIYYMTRDDVKAFFAY
ncbi:MAG: hypothetical protein QXN59_02890 [Candidatus Micrarchaeaceae archaeon]